jgi:DNA-3-methyladenine glycosylase II
MLERATRHLRKADPVLAGIIERVGPCALAAREPTFETLARSITFQQLHGKAAAAIFARVKKAAGRRFTAQAFLRLTEAELRACGLSRQKIASLSDLAQRVARREIRFRKLAEMPDEEILELLCRVRGVGIWTVQMFLLFALERPNVLPLSDFGIRNAVRKAYGLSELPTVKELAAIAEPWHPYCSVASWYLWRSLEAPAEI